MTIAVFVPKDASARSVGADEVADAIVAEAVGRGVDIKVVRNGSRGLLWLEPMVEVVAPDGRYAFGPVSVADVSALFDARWDDPAGPVARAHPLALGLTVKLAGWPVRTGSRSPGSA